MMMQGRHLKNALLAQLVRGHLQNHRTRLDDKYSSDERQQKFLLDDHGDGADCTTQSKRAHIAHENFRWVRVVPQESDRRSDHCTAKNGQLTDLRHALKLEIGSERRVPTHVGKNGQSSSRDHSATNGQTVETVGKINGV